MNNENVFLVQYLDREPDTGNYIVKKLINGEIVSVPAASGIYILSLEPGQMLMLFCPKEQPEGFLFAPI